MLCGIVALGFGLPGLTSRGPQGDDVIHAQALSPRSREMPHDPLTSAVSAQQSHAALDISAIEGFGTLPLAEQKSLAQAAAQLNRFVREGVRIEESRLKSLHALAGAASFIKAIRKSSDGSLYRSQAHMPAEFLGAYRDGEDYLLKLRYARGMAELHEVPFEIEIPRVLNGVEPGIRVSRLMADYFQWLETSLSQSADPVGLAIESYVRFVKIQPFIGLNHRTGWLLLNWILLQSGRSAFYVTRSNVSEYDIMGRLVMVQSLPAAIASFNSWFRADYARQRITSSAT